MTALIVTISKVSVKYAVLRQNTNLVREERVVVMWLEQMR